MKRVYQGVLIVTGAGCVLGLVAPLFGWSPAFALGGAAGLVLWPVGWRSACTYPDGPEPEDL